MRGRTCNLERAILRDSMPLPELSASLKTNAIKTRHSRAMVQSPSFLTMRVLTFNLTVSSLLPSGPVSSICASHVLIIGNKFF